MLWFHGSVSKDAVVLRNANAKLQNHGGFYLNFHFFETIVQKIHRLGQ